MNIRLRPRFVLCVGLPSERVVERFQRHVDEGTSLCEIFLLKGQIELATRPEERHYWSPYLKMILEEEEEHTVLRGNFGPNINVWTMFLAAYAVLFLTGSIGLIAATSQLQIGQSPTGLLISAACLLLSVVVWITAKIGQRLAYDQMVAIHQFVHELFSDSAGEANCEACTDDEGRDSKA